MRKHISLISVALLLTGWSATAGIPRTAAQQAITKIRGQEPLRTKGVKDGPVDVVYRYLPEPLHAPNDVPPPNSGVVPTNDTLLMCDKEVIEV